MNNNKKSLFLVWFLSGGFFSALKKEIQKDEDNGTNEFKIVFFDNVQEDILAFLSSSFTRVRNARIGEAQLNYMNSPHMNLVKNLILGEDLDGLIDNIKDRLNTHGDIISDEPRTVSMFMVSQYENFRKSKSCILYVRSLNGQVCSYCDKSIIDCTDNHFYGDLDHIYDKAEHYYLALNMSNLTPCCKVCNQLKGIRKVLFNPIKQDLDDIFNFYIDDADLGAISSDLSGSYNVELKLKHKDANTEDILSNLNETLSLNDRYKNCSHVANHLMQLKRVYTENYINNIQDIIGYQLEDNDLKNLLLGIYSRSNKSKIQPLTKLIYDLSAQIHLFDQE